MEKDCSVSSSESIRVDQWFYSPFEGEWVLVRPQEVLGRIIEKSALWGNRSFRIWLPSSDSIIHVDPSVLSATQSSALIT